MAATTTRRITRQKKTFGKKSATTPNQPAKQTKNNIKSTNISSTYEVTRTTASDAAALCEPMLAQTIIKSISISGAFNRAATRCRHQDLQPHGDYFAVAASAFSTRRSGAL